VSVALFVKSVVNEVDHSTVTFAQAFNKGKVLLEGVIWDGAHLLLVY